MVNVTSSTRSPRFFSQGVWLVSYFDDHASSSECTTLSRPLCGSISNDNPDILAKNQSIRAFRNSAAASLLRGIRARSSRNLASTGSVTVCLVAWTSLGIKLLHEIHALIPCSKVSLNNGKYANVDVKFRTFLSVFQTGKLSAFSHEAWARVLRGNRKAQVGSGLIRFSN